MATPAPLRPSVSVVMPTFEQAAFVGRAIASVVAQDVPTWELIVVDDGSRDDTVEAVAPFLGDRRISLHRSTANTGLGAALNRGLARAAAPFVAYLPSDDRWDRHHLSAVLQLLRDGAALAWSGVVHHGSQRSLGPPPGMPLQLVQVAHRLTGDRWVERSELETDDLEALLWDRLRHRGPARGTGVVSCEWTDHPHQRHKAMLERFDGGLNVFRRRYRITTPLRFRSSDSWLVDEARTYAPLRRAPAPPASDGLRILLVGELAFNPERVLAFEERGHQLFGLWTEDGLGSHTVGPLPFGHVTDLPGDSWRSAVRELRPDVIYALLNWRAVPLAAAVLRERGDTPFVFHFKESPMRCMRRGTWPALVDLVTKADLALLASPEEREWFDEALPGRIDPQSTDVLDGDLPKCDWLSGDPTPRLSEDDGDIHTVVLGRPIGLDAATVTQLAERGVHIHLHGPVRAPGVTGQWTEWIDDARTAAPGHVHVHPHIAQPDWRRVISRYDAGWLHAVGSDNDGDISRATWDDLNVPARLPVYLAAGVPVIQRSSPGARVAAQRMVADEGFGILYEDVTELADRLVDRPSLAAARRSAETARTRYTFDHHVDGLLDRFRALAR